MTTGLSRSSPRVRGAYYQHLFAWLHALEAFGGNVAKIGIEDPAAENADDVMVYEKDGARRFHQLKYSVDYSRPANIAWITESRKTKQSMIQRFHKLWSRHGRKITITLATNRLPARGDPLSKADGDDNTIERYLSQEEPGSRKTRADLANHIGIAEEEAISFFRDIKFKLGLDPDSLKTLAKLRMHAAGLRNDDDALALGVGIVDGWVKEGRKEITAAEVRQAAWHLKRDDVPTGSLLVQMIDRDPEPQGATVALDWTDSFRGSEPRSRFLPRDPRLWNGKFRPQLQRAVQKLRLPGGAHVLVRGYMRLPTWFAAGTELARTAGFEVSSIQGKDVWSSAGEPADASVECDTANLELGGDLAVGIALSWDLSQDVLEYVRGQKIGAARYVCVRPAAGPSSHAISSAAEARGWALATRDRVRCLVGEHRPGRTHLFLAGPQAAILLLGHLWDRMGPTQLYEYVGPGKGYAPSYFMPS